MNSFLRYIYRYIKSIQLTLRGVRVSPYAYFNRNSLFEGANVVHKGTSVSGAEIGYGTYIGSNTQLSNATIGRYCSIASNVKVVTATHPTKDFVSTSPMFFSTLKQTGKTYCNTSKFNEFLTLNGRSVIIGSDVWIGENVTIKGGITIGHGAIIAMNACVTKDVPPYAIVGGVPAKIIKYRFTENDIQLLLSIKWWDKPEEWIIQHLDSFTDIGIFLKNVSNENSTCRNSSSI